MSVSQQLIQQLIDLKPGFAPFFGHICNCTAMNLTNKALTAVPMGVTHLSRVRYLRLGENQLSSLPSEISVLRTLFSLDIHHNHFTSLSPDISCLVNLEDIDISDNPIEELPPQITALTRLSKLDIGTRGIITIKRAPRGITDLPCWRDVSSQEMMRPGWKPNQLDIRITSLNFSGMRVSGLPENITGLTNITYLNVSNNMMTVIPTSVCLMKNVRILDFSNNKVTMIPHEVVGLVNLNIFNISNNKVRILPTFLGDIKMIRSGLIAHGNPIDNIPQNVIRQGSGAIYDYLVVSNRGVENWKEGRILLLGEGSAGKTTLAKSIKQTSKCFERTVDSHRKRTDGIEQLTVDIHDMSIKDSLDSIPVRIWDFGGQEDFQVTHPFFLSSGALVLLLYRLDQSAKKNNLKRWIKMLDDFAPGSKIMIIGTHLDRENRIFVQEMEVEIVEIKAENKCHAFLGTDVKVSNLNGRGVASLRQILCGALMEFDHVRKGVPKIYINLRDHLESRGRFEKYENIQQTYEYAETRLKISEKQCESALRFLHDLGTVIWYWSHKSANDIVFLDPLFLINIFRCVFSFDGVGRNTHGILLIEELKKKIKRELEFDFDGYAFETIINMFERFGVGIQFNPECIAFPAFMKECHNSKILWNEKHESHCVSEIEVELISYAEIQPSDMSNVIVQTLRWTNDCPPGAPYEDRFFKKTALIHLKAVKSPGSYEISLTSGLDFVVLVEIHPTSIAIKIRKYANYAKDHEIIPLFDLMLLMARRFSYIRPKFIQHCILQCPKCQNEGCEGFIGTSILFSDEELNKCTNGHELDPQHIKQGRVFMEQGMPSLSTGKKKNKEASPNIADILELELIDRELSELWIQKPVELKSYLEKGNYGRVYRANGDEGSSVVVKIQTVKGTVQESLSEVIKSIIAESKLLKECEKCDNIVKLVGVYRIASDFYMVMENAGVSLKTILESNQGKLELGQINSYAKQICRGLLFMQKINLYHEDLKADNIMVLNKRVKIIDFGIVSRRGLNKVGSRLPTRFGEWKQGGTSNWQAPEVHEVVCRPYYHDDAMYGEDGENIGHRGEPSTVYAIGMLIWYMFSGMEPYYNETEPQSLTIRGLRPHIPEDVPSDYRHLISVCWKQNYKLRPDISTVKLCLDKVLSREPGLQYDGAVLRGLIPIAYADVAYMYKGEFVEWLYDCGHINLGKRFSDRCWVKVEDIIELLTQGMINAFHINSDDVTDFFNMSTWRLDEAERRGTKNYVRELSHFQLIDYLTRRGCDLSQRLLPKVRWLHLDGETISKLNEREVLEKHSVMEEEEIEDAVRLIITHLIR